MPASVTAIANQLPHDHQRGPCSNPGLHQWSQAIKHNIEKQKASDRGEHESMLRAREATYVHGKLPDQNPSPPPEVKTPPPSPTYEVNDITSSDTEAAVLFATSLSNLR